MECSPVYMRGIDGPPGNGITIIRGKPAVSAGVSKNQRGICISIPYINDQHWGHHCDHKKVSNTII